MQRMSLTSLNSMFDLRILFLLGLAFSLAACNPADSGEEKTGDQVTPADAPNPGSTPETSAPDGLDGLLALSGQLRELKRDQAIAMLTEPLGIETETTMLEGQEENPGSPYRRVVSLDREQVFLNLILYYEEEYYALGFLPEYVQPVLGTDLATLYYEFEQHCLELQSTTENSLDFEISLADNHVLLRENGVAIKMTESPEGYLVAVTRYDEDIYRRKGYPVSPGAEAKPEALEAFIAAYLPVDGEIDRFEHKEGRVSMYFNVNLDWEMVAGEINMYAKDAGFTTTADMASQIEVGAVFYKDPNGMCTLALLNFPDPDPEYPRYILAYEEKTQ